MSNTQSLPTVVEALEDKARKKKQAENTQYHVSVAQHNIREINNELDDLITSLRDLRYYKTVFEEAFDGSAPMLVSSATQSAEKAIESTQEQLLEDVQSSLGDDGETELGSDTDHDNLKVQLTPKVSKQISQIQSATQMVDNVTEQIEGQLESKQKAWSTKVSAAEELQKILGGQDGDFVTTLNHMHTLLTRKLMDSSGSASNFVSQWTNAVSNWEQHQSLQSFDDFQEKHNLSDSTVEDVKTLSQSGELTLADVSLETIKEMKRVDELESAIELSL
jgi:rRNA maturation endonuclease Nob1